MNDDRFHPINRITTATRRLLKMSLWAGLALTGGPLGGQVPDGPPDIEPTSFNTFNPKSLGTRVIPPFNAADPGSTILAVGQMVELIVVLSQPAGAGIQWVKDEENLPGKTRTSIHIPKVSQQDTGDYRIDVTYSGTADPSFEVGFQVLTSSEIDDVLASWSNRFFTFEQRDDPAISGETADPDLDGLGNLIEYFFGLNPTRSSPPPELRLTGSIASKVSFSYARTQERTDVTHTVEGSNGLEEWVPLSVTQTTVTPIDEATERVEVELDWPFEPAFPRFLQLVVEQADP